MREIQFRGHTGTKWVYGNLIQTKSNKADGDRTCWIQVATRLGLGAVSTPTSNFHKVISKSVGQFTGMHDQDRFGIYEGDILETSYEYVEHNPYSDGDNDDSGLYRGIVHYQPSKGFIQKKCIANSEFDDDGWKKRGNLTICQSSTTCIGNDHENPGLLENEHE